MFISEFMRIATIPILLAICNESRIDFLACYELRDVGGGVIEASVAHMYYLACTILACLVLAEQKRASQVCVRNVHTHTCIHVYNIYHNQ